MSDPGNESTPKLIEVRPEADHRLWLRYDDGVEGIVDLSGEIRAGGVFAALEERAVFAAVELGKFGQVKWAIEIDMCPNALYLRLTRKAPRELFPGLARQPTDA